MRQIVVFSLANRGSKGMQFQVLHMQMLLNYLREMSGCAVYVFFLLRHQVQRKNLSWYSWWWTLDETKQFG